jgi:hypothetical protein
VSPHIWVPLTVAFTLGILLRLFQRATRAFRSKLRCYPTRWSFVAGNWDVFLLRSLWNGALFVLWLFKPGFISNGLVWLHVPQNFANWLTVPPTLGSAIGFGYLVDLALDQIQMKIASTDSLKWLPDSLKGEIPLYDQNAVNSDTVVQKNERDTAAS